MSMAKPQLTQKNDSSCGLRGSGLHYVVPALAVARVSMIVGGAALTISFAIAAAAPTCISVSLPLAIQAAICIPASKGLTWGCSFHVTHPCNK